MIREMSEFGNTHPEAGPGPIAYNRYHGRTLAFNPGSATDRRRSPRCSYGLLTLDAEGIQAEIRYLDRYIGEISGPIQGGTTTAAGLGRLGSNTAARGDRAMAEHQTRHQDHQKRFNPPGVQEPLNQDLQLQQEVKDALLRGTESAGIDVKVSAEDGAIRLHGVVDALSHKRAAEEIARRIPGVHTIDNDITVANEETYTDKDIELAVTGKLGNRREFRQMGCQVHKGVVTLVGHAGSYDDVEAAVRMVEDMGGVREVRADQVKVGEGEKEDDADVSRRAQRLLKEMGYDPRQFLVYCDAGVLFVKGFVPTREDRSRVKTAMHQIRGVAKLEALLVTDDEVDGEIH